MCNYVAYNRFYKLCFLHLIFTFRAIHTGTPAYLACELHRHQPPRALLFGATTTLHRPHASSGFHQHSFAVSALVTCFHLRFWHVEQNCSEHTSSTLPTHHATYSHPLAPPIHSFVTYGAIQRNICD